MKKLRLLLILMLICCWGSFCNAQDWRTLRTNGSYMFMADVNELFSAYRVDSVWVSGNDSIFMSFPVIQRMDYNCYSPTEGSWMGRRMVAKPNGDNVFINYSYDSLVIKTTAGAGDSWQMCDSGNVVASVIAVKDTNFLGLNDSVKVISLNSPISYINGSKVLLSKHYGLIKTPELFHFPNDPMMDQYCIYSLQGMSNPAVGVQNLTRVETYTYSVGDEFHRYTFDKSGGFGTPIQIDESWAIYHVVEKLVSASPDSLKYRFERCMKQRIYYGTVDSTAEVFTKIHDTILIIHLLNNSDVMNFDQLPGEPVFDNSNVLYEHRMGLHPSGLRSKTYPDIDENYWMLNPLCWQVPIVDACIGPSYVFEGIYGADFNCSYYEIESNYELVYFKKGIQTWGTSYSCEIILSDEFNNELMARKVTVSPNPATDYFEISLKNMYPNLSFELYNLTGHLVKSALINESSITIQCSDLPAGLFLYRITNATGFMSCGKLAVQ